MKLWDCLDEIDQEWLKRYQRKNYNTELNPPAAESPPTQVIPIHIDEADIRESKKIPHHPRGEGYGAH